MIRTITAAVVTARLNYAKSVLYGIPAKYKSLASSVVKILSHVLLQVVALLIVLLIWLHWLPVHDRIKFKIATMTHKAIYTGNHGRRNRGRGVGDNVPPLLDQRDTGGYREGRSNENDLCFYSRQSLFSTVQVTEFQLP